MSINITMFRSPVWIGIFGFWVSSFAAAPNQPLPSPLFSFDLASPAVMNGFVEADDVLELHLPYPNQTLSAAILGLGATGDELDALSGGHPSFSPQTRMALRFSVTRDSTGNVPPSPILEGLRVPFNVMDQAIRGHQAGDEFISIRIFTLESGAQPASSTYDDNHSMVKNNYDEGGSDFAARPETHAISESVGAAQDNVDALADLDVAMAAYYSVSSTSPSLSSLPGSTSSSGANIFRSRIAIISMYASYSQLGLQRADDVDAIVVFDVNANGVFDGNDRVLFSLTPQSPSLAVIPGASVNAGADVFIAVPNQPAALFATAASLGLSSPADDVDALEILNCDDSLACAAAFSIRANRLGDFDGDSDVDAVDLEVFNRCFSGTAQAYNLGCEPGDFDSDGDIDCKDGADFVETADSPISAPTRCRRTLSPISQWDPNTKTSESRLPHN